MKITPIKTRIIEPNESLLDFITEHILTLEDKSVLVIASKIVSFAQGRLVKKISDEVKDRLVQEESEFAVKTPYCWMTIKDGMIMASAGIDESNVPDGQLLLAPDNSFKVARKLRETLMAFYKVKELGVIITDSRTVIFQKGTIGVSMGYAGFEGIRSYVGKTDLFGREFKMQRVNVPEALSASAVFEMGEGTETQPLAIIEKTNIEFTDRQIDSQELIIDPKDDMYGAIFSGAVKDYQENNPISEEDR